MRLHAAGFTCRFVSFSHLTFHNTYLLVCAKKTQRPATGSVIVGINTSYVFDNSLCDG